MKLKALAGNADHQLRFVVLAANRLRWPIVQGAADSQIAAAWFEANVAQKRSRTKVETLLDQAWLTVESKLSLLERLEALSEYNSMMDHFDMLGDKLTAILRLYRQVEQERRYRGATALLAEHARAPKVLHLNDPA